MKKIINGMLLSASALAFVAAPAMTTPVFAQDTAAASQQCNTTERDALYKVFYENAGTKENPATPEKKETAYKTAKQYLEKYDNPNCPDESKVIPYIKDKWIPNYENIKLAEEKQAKLARFNTAVKDQNGAEIFAAGKAYMKDYPDDPVNLSIVMFMADGGFIQTNTKKVDTFNNDTVATAKATIEKINAGKTPAEGNWAPFKSKEDALAWLNYDLGYIYLFKMQNKNDSVPYFYQTTKYNSPDITPSPIPYRAIGDWYLDKYTKAAEEYNAKKDDPNLSEDEKNKLAGTWKAYADRAMEAYGFAYTKAKSNPKSSEVAKEINDTLTQIYKLRHSGEATGLDAYVSGLSGKQLTDPTTPVTPIVETTPETSTASITATSSDTSTPAKTGATTPATKTTTTAKPTPTPAKPNDSGTKPVPPKKPTPKNRK